MVRKLMLLNMVITTVSIVPTGAMVTESVQQLADNQAAERTTAV